MDYNSHPVSGPPIYGAPMKTWVSHIEFTPCVPWHQSERFYIIAYADDLKLYGSTGYLMYTTILALITEVPVTKMGQVSWF
jgi:hypothetical protein